LLDVDTNKKKKVKGFILSVLRSWENIFGCINRWLHFEIEGGIIYGKTASNMTSLIHMCGKKKQNCPPLGRSCSWFSLTFTVSGGRK
jgi:hypothetical protein